MSMICGRGVWQGRGRSIGLNLRCCLWVGILALLVASWAAQAEEADEQYVAIYNAIQQADSLVTSNNTTAALKKYRDAQTALQNLQRAYPNWNRSVVSFRLDYLAQKIASFSEPARPAAPGNVAVAAGETPGATKRPEAAGAVQVKLLAAGAEPRKVLRLHPKPGDHQTLNMTLNVNMGIHTGEMETPAMKLPTIKMALETTVKNVAADGEITYDMMTGDASVADEPGVMPQVAEALKATLARFKGLTGTGKLSDRGLSRGAELKAPPGADPQLGQFIEQMKDSFSRFTAPLPEEAVGPGARWEAKMPIKSQGMAMDQTTVYELVSLEGERVSTRSTVSQRAGNQTVDNPAMPGVKAQLTRMDGRGKGEVTFDLTRILPQTGNAQLHTDMAMAIDAGGQKQAMTMKMDVQVGLEAK